MNQRVSDVAVTLCMGFLLAEVEQIGESPMAICLQRAHAQFIIAETNMDNAIRFYFHNKFFCIACTVKKVSLRKPFFF